MRDTPSKIKKSKIRFVLISLLFLNTILFLNACYETKITVSNIPKNSEALFYPSLNITDDSLVQTCPPIWKEELLADLKRQRNHWMNIASPFIAIYKGNDISDYFHLNFEDSLGTNYDFGFGANQFGQYQLFEPSGHYIDNSDYLNQVFLIYWDWKIAQFPCCSGEYELVEAYTPSIISLELIQKP